MFPAPFALTLSGRVDLAKNTTTFTNLPDIPLTDLKVTLAGGPNAVFATPCVTPSGIGTATLTSERRQDRGPVLGLLGLELHHARRGRRWPDHDPAGAETVPDAGSQERGAADHLSLAGRPCPRQGDAEA